MREKSRKIAIIPEHDCGKPFNLFINCLLNRLTFDQFYLSVCMFVSLEISIVSFILYFQPPRKITNGRSKHTNYTQIEIILWHSFMLIDDKACARSLRQHNNSRNGKKPKWKMLNDDNEKKEQKRTRHTQMQS